MTLIIVTDDVDSGFTCIIAWLGVFSQCRCTAKLVQRRVVIAALRTIRYDANPQRGPCMYIVAASPPQILLKTVSDRRDKTRQNRSRRIASSLEQNPVVVIQRHDATRSHSHVAHDSWTTIDYDRYQTYTIAVDQSIYSLGALWLGFQVSGSTVHSARRAMWLRSPRPMQLARYWKIK